MREKLGKSQTSTPIVFICC